jgi:hypothetical protein
VTESSPKRTAALRADAGIAAIDRPKPAGVNAPAFGSDVAADALRATGVPYIALNPGASYRGFHDSIVNYLGNEQPQMLLCLHEESAIAIAHGYAKVTGQAMAAAVHSNVGLMHGTMAIFNAWCDRMPVVLLGATGPAMDRLDPHCARPGRVGARLHEMGRPAVVAGCGPRSHPARGLDFKHRAVRPDLRQPRRRHAGREACRRHPTD